MDSNGNNSGKDYNDFEVEMEIDRQLEEGRVPRRQSPSQQHLHLEPAILDPSYEEPNLDSDFINGQAAAEFGHVMPADVEGGVLEMRADAMPLWPGVRPELLPSHGK
jgi:hypothetical protein